MKLLQGNCLEIMKDIEDKSIDMILCDLPYGTTACKWDTVIPFEPLWEQYKRIIKDNGAIVLFGSEPFSSHLRMSNIKNYKYDWVWDKKKSGNPLNVKYQPLKIHENILIFSLSSSTYSPKIIMNYNPIMTKRARIVNSGTVKINDCEQFHSKLDGKNRTYTEKYPVSIIISSNANQTKRLHPTQKPVTLMEYLIKTYTNENDLVLDNCMGSGTTGVACKNLSRDFIGIELDEEYFKIAKERIKNSVKQETLI